MCKHFNCNRNEDVFMLMLCGMEGAAMDYALQGHAVAHVPLGGSVFQCVVSHREEDYLLLHLPHGKPPHLPREQKPVYVHFEINHGYFDGLHKAIDGLSADAISKLLPKKSLLPQYTTGKSLSRQEKDAILEFSLDNEYQISALERMISSDPRVPFLVLGPFGTGKTHILVAAVSALLCNLDSGKHILVCTHHHQCANNIYQKLYRKYPNDILRLIPNRKALHYICMGKQGVVLMKEVRDRTFHERVVVTTFLTATNLHEMRDTSNCSMTFSHILIDDGAQTREPEALGALTVVKPETKIVILGDNQQNGPKVVVLSKLAQDNELGDSLLERLFTYYKTAGASLKNHTASLLMNYRCHSSILTLTSSLFYQHTLLSCSSSQIHPLAPYPLVFTCSSIEQQSLKNLPVENPHEAKVLVQNMHTYIDNWPRSKERPTVGLLASTREQVNVLKKELWKRKKDFHCEVKTLPTYLIQGEEFDAVFLSTIEPTDENGNPYDPVRSIGNKLVFNTIMTRARSLIYCVGNPFVLCELGSKYQVNCWSAYLQRCVQCETLHFALPCESVSAGGVEAAAKEVQQRVFPHSVLDKVTDIGVTTKEADSIIEQYIWTLKGRREYKTSCKLVRTPQNVVDWMGEEETGTEDNIILCYLDYKFFNQAKAVPLDPSQPATMIKGRNKLKGSFPGDTVRVDIKQQCVVFDDKTKEAIKRTHFGTSFLCRVSKFDCIEFYPLDKCYPKFVNLPTITREEKEGVVCFDPSSINSTPRVCNVIPHEVALKMVFVVKFLGWEKRFGYPLGIIVGAFPSRSSHFQEILLKMRYDIPLSIVEFPAEEMEYQGQRRKAMQQKCFTQAITIDPEGSKDHDDALTCTFKQKGNKEIYSVGVHITSLNSIVNKGNKVDKQAQQRGCTVYNAPDSISSPLFPGSVLSLASISPAKPVECFTVLTNFIVADAGLKSESIELGDVSISENIVTSEAELTYSEAQLILLGDEASYPQALSEKVRSYNANSPTLTLNQMTKCLWQFAWFLRKKRLGDAALAYTVRENDTLLHLEAHYLVEELMIWANMHVAKKLRKYFKNETILRSQKPPGRTELDQFCKNFQTVLPLSAACKTLMNKSPTTVSPLMMLKSKHSMLREHLKNRKLREVMHCVQVEHFHPQLAALQSVLRSMQSSAQYCVLEPNDKDGGGHSDLQCSPYTHFTSPLRRYIDVIVQRQLHAALGKKNNVYTIDELNAACATTEKKLKDARNYEKDISSSKLVNSLKNSQSECDCIITQVDPKQGVISLCFTDIELHLGPKGSELTIQQLHRNHSKVRETETSMPYSWKVKVCSLTGIPASFLDPAEIEVSCTSDENGQLTFYIPDDSDCLIKRSVSIKVKSKVEIVLSQTWLKLQECIMKGEPSMAADSTVILRNITPTDSKKCVPIPHKGWRSSLCVYTLNKVLKPFDVMKVQLCATQGKHIIEEPAIQLLEVGPGIRICIHHNKDAEKCFVGKLMRNASKDVYDSLTDYVRSWEPLVLSEAAYTSVKESEFLLVRDVQMIWPDFQLCTSSAGISYYKITDSINPDKCGIRVILPKEFMQSSFRSVFKISKGDLVCIRLSSNDSATKCVFHMVVSHVELDEDKVSPVDVYMKFVSDDSNYISQQVHRAIQKNIALYEIQLIPTSTSLRRVYRALMAIPAGTELAKSIALGISTAAHHKSHSKRMEDMLSHGEVSIATSYWPTTDKKSLNCYQRQAIELAWNCKLSMIQGPPGTGKSITGAHIAYSLAMRLCKERSEGQADAKMCVMYCGPSQQSVNVVLDIFLQMLNSPEQNQKSIGIVRVFSKAVEKAEFPGPELNSDVFTHFNSSAKCERRHQAYSLHHLVRRANPEITKMEERFKLLHREGKIPCFADIQLYGNLVSHEEERVFRSGVNIVLCTCNEAASHRITNTLRPKYCIIDECAMATEPECMVPIRRAEHVVLIGDHKQLQPVIQSKDVEKMGLGKSLFERYARKAGQVKVHVLEVQYRMHPAICEFPSQVFYEGKLKTDKSVERRHSGLHLNSFWPRSEQKPMVFCQVEGEEDSGYLGPKGCIKVRSQSKFNQKEAKKIVDIAEKLVCQFNVPNSEIAILTPYTAQREAINDELMQRREQQKKQKERRVLGDIQIKTITESQGTEYGIVLLSTVRSMQCTAQDSSETADTDWIRKNLGFVADPHRICVGITRCKFGLVIVGNEKVLKYDHIWKRLISHYKKEDCFMKGEEFPS